MICNVWFCIPLVAEKGATFGTLIADCQGFSEIEIQYIILFFLNTESAVQNVGCQL